MKNGKNQATFSDLRQNNSEKRTRMPYDIWLYESVEENLYRDLGGSFDRLIDVAGLDDRLRELCLG